MEVRTLLLFEFQAGFVITILVTVFYGIFAPWYKQAAGRYIFGLLFSLSLVLTNSMVSLWWPGNSDGRRLIGALLFGFYILAILAIGYGIYRAQIVSYRRRKFIEKERERHRQL